MELLGLRTCSDNQGSRGLSYAKSPNAELAKTALNHAIRRQQPDTTKLIFHSKQGMQNSAKSLIHHTTAVSIIESYIYFYNYKRLHSTLGYITFVQKIAELKKAV